MATDVREKSYLDTLLEAQGRPPAGSPSFLSELRADALEHANALRVPTTRDEDWRFTDLSPLYRTSFPAAHAPAALIESAIAPFVVSEAHGRLVFVDGFFAPEFSVVLADGGITIASLASALAMQNERVRAQLGQVVDFRKDPFAAVNTAWLRDAAVVLVDEGTSVERPIHILFLGATPGTAAYPRVLIAAEADSRCTVVEEFASLHGESGFTNGVSEILLGENASLRHVRLQQESSAAFHIATCRMLLARGAKCSSVSVALGARLSRYNVGVVQGGEGADWQLDGVAVISGRQLADTHSVFDHGAAHGRSRQLHKCIAGGAAHAVFNGKILVRPGAQQTDSGQQSRNLLLSDRASIDTKPELEIFADDVKCAHGATVGQLDAEQVFYLKSRGLSDASSRNLLTFAFAAEVVERIAIPSLVARIEDFVLKQTQSKESQ